MSNTNIKEIFENFLDQLFYEGYAHQLAINEPEWYKTEFSNFKNSYTWKR